MEKPLKPKGFNRLRSEPQKEQVNKIHTVYYPIRHRLASDVPSNLRAQLDFNTTLIIEGYGHTPEYMNEFQQVADNNTNFDINIQTGKYSDFHKGLVDAVRGTQCKVISLDQSTEEILSSPVLMESHGTEQVAMQYAKVMGLPSYQGTIAIAYKLGETLSDGRNREIGNVLYLFKKNIESEASSALIRESGIVEKLEKLTETTLAGINSKSKSKPKFIILMGSAHTHLIQRIKTLPNIELEVAPSHRTLTIFRELILKSMNGLDLEVEDLFRLFLSKIVEPVYIEIYEQNYNMKLKGIFPPKAKFTSYQSISEKIIEFSKVFKGRRLYDFRYILTSEIEKALMTS